MQWLKNQFLTRLKEAFEDGKPGRSVEFTEEELRVVKGFIY